MKAPQLGRLYLPAILVACLGVGSFANAQARAGGGRTSGSSITVGRPIDPMGLPGTVSVTVFISGKVTLDDGTELSEPAAIQTICRGDRHTQTYTDHKGSFSFQLGDAAPSAGADVADAGNTMTTRTSSQRDQRSWRECEVQAVLAGFSSDLIELASRVSALESTDLGRVVLHRLEHVEGTSISVTSALAPSGAKKALDKGREAERKKNWSQAVEALGKAVQIYPKYAAAWFELGRVQMIQNDSAAAKHSFEQAVTADSKYVPPYQGLAELAFSAKQWPEVVQTTEQLLTLNPVSFPAAYFFNAVANYYLPNLDAAEKSARQGIRVDTQNQVVKMRYLLGVILVQKHDFQQAADYFHQYMTLTKESSELEAANRQLAEIAKLNPAANSDAGAPKK